MSGAGAGQREALSRADRLAGAIEVARQRQLANVLYVSEPGSVGHDQLETLLHELMAAYGVPSAMYPSILGETITAWSRECACGDIAPSARWSDVYAGAMRAAARLTAIAARLVRQRSPLLGRDGGDA